MAAPLDLGQGAGADTDPAGQLPLGQSGGDAQGADLLADASSCAGCFAKDVNPAVVADHIPQGAPDHAWRLPSALTTCRVCSVGWVGVASRSTTTWVMSASRERNAAGWASRSSSQ
jgi:hypothetical protein